MMVVVDTNVTIAANGQNTHAGLSCQYACVDFLEKIVSNNSRTKIALDECGLILAEYKLHLSHSGQPGVGDMFFKYLHDHMYRKQKVKLFQINPIEDEACGFAELPINDLDKSDRKFLAVAVIAHARIVNALDTDWHLQSEIIKRLNVTVTQLCPEHAAKVG